MPRAADCGPSIRTSAPASNPQPSGPKALAAVGIYDLSSGKALDYVDLAPLAPAPHLLNGITVDAAGNAYVTDSFSPNIYKIDAEGRPSLFVHDERFVGAGINLNGIVAHPDGFLLVIKKSDGGLFRHPASPARTGVGGRDCYAIRGRGRSNLGCKKKPGGDRQPHAKLCRECRLRAFQ